MDEKQLTELWKERTRSTAKKAVCRAAFIALASAISSFGIYLFGWRRGGGDVVDNVGDLIDAIDEDEKEEEES